MNYMCSMCPESQTGSHQAQTQSKGSGRFLYGLIHEELYDEVLCGHTCSAQVFSGCPAFQIARGGNCVELGHGFWFRDWIRVCLRGYVFPSACNQGSFLVLLQILDTGTPCSRSVEGGGNVYPAVPSAQPMFAHPSSSMQHSSQKKPLLMPLARWSTQQQHDLCVLWFGPGGVKGQKERGCCWRGRQWHLPGCSPACLACVCRHRALGHL